MIRSAAMQTERVTFLTSRDHKAALDAYAQESGMSVGRVVREATSRYMAQPSRSDEYDDALTMALPELDAAFTSMNAKVRNMRAAIAHACAAVDAALAGDPK
jgi:hypothetical protein